MSNQNQGWKHRFFAGVVLTATRDSTSSYSCSPPPKVRYSKPTLLKPTITQAPAARLWQGLGFRATFLEIQDMTLVSLSSLFVRTEGPIYKRRRGPSSLSSGSSVVALLYGLPAPSAPGWWFWCADYVQKLLRALPSMTKHLPCPLG